MKRCKKFVKQPQTSLQFFVFKLEIPFVWLDESITIARLRFQGLWRPSSDSISPCWKILFTIFKKKKCNFILGQHAYYYICLLHEILHFASSLGPPEATGSGALNPALIITKALTLHCVFSQKKSKHK